VRTFLVLRNEQAEPLPAGVLGPDIRYPESLVRHFLEAYTREWDTVFDPFTGFGTTLRVAEAMGRVPVGLELNPGRCRYARCRLQNPDALLRGDARRLGDYSLPPFDFSITSPPYMNRHDPENPLTDYTEIEGGYEQYLTDLRDIYEQIAARMKPGARAVIEVANLKSGGEVTTLAWDIAGAISSVLHFEGEVIVGWEPTYAYGYDHSYCLVFRKD